MLRLPSYQELSTEQDEINNLPLNGTHLVIGPPGSGKTVMAIYRAAMFRRMGKKSHFLVYNRPLMQYLNQATIAVGLRGSVSTFHSWFRNWYDENFGRWPPKLSEWVFDWPAIFQALASKSSYERYEHLTIDEGQDFPKEFYMVIRLIADSITVFADENQRIGEQNSTIRDIQLYLGLGAQQPHLLTRNYRNTRPIAELAKEFYVGLPTGIPRLPTRMGGKPHIVRAPDIEAQGTAIARYERNNPDRDIGVFVLWTDHQRELYRRLSQLQTVNEVQMYVSGQREHRSLNFAAPGIKVLSYGTAKGLEFDTVFLPELEAVRSFPDSDHEKMRYYVLTSRAREAMFFLFSGEEDPPPLKAIPTHLVERRRIR